MRTGNYAQKERDEAIVALCAEGVPLSVAATVYRLGRGMARRAELACSSEAADRDRVPCPKRFRRVETRQDQAPVEHCLCRDYGAYDDAQSELEDRHGDIPRIAVQDAQGEARIRALLRPYGIEPNFSGDPRGFVVKVKLPSGKHNTWGGAEEGWGIA